MSETIPPLKALSPLDGRYHETVVALTPQMSEEALMRYRIRVEASWLLMLADHPGIYPGTLFRTMNPTTTEKVRELLEKWATGAIPANSVALIKELERTTRHDVKAVEYYLARELKEVGASSELRAFLHFACTSEDINNLAYGLMMADVRKDILLPTLQQLITQLQSMAERYSSHAMVSRTHGQVASPTTMGKEIAVFAHRLQRQYLQLESQQILGKCAGAVGNYNAHIMAYPHISWPELTQDFVEQKLGLTWNPMVTQIESHDGLAEYLDILRRICTIGVDLCRDVWGYISLGYLLQKVNLSETGSSTMPHKVNPIDFENAEGNFGLAHSLATHLCHKLPISRWQRDLSDSTVMRSLGTVIGYYHVAVMHLLRGLSKVTPHSPTLLKDLDHSWEVLAEAVQTLWRKHGMVDAYERLKDLTRGQEVDHKLMEKIIKDGAEHLSPEDFERLQNLTPRTYIGLAESLSHLSR